MATAFQVNAFQNNAFQISGISVTVTGGRQVSWSEIESVEKRSIQFLRDHGAPIPRFTTPESQAASRLGYYGGVASGISRRK